MRVSLFFFALLCSVNLLSQVPVQPDSTFNSTGRKVFTFGSNVLNYGDNIAIQPDGKIIMTGATFDGGLGGLTKLGVCRMFPDGSMDPSFGTDGFTKVDLGTLGYNGGFEPEIALQGDGSMYINGFTQDGASTGDDMLVCKLLANGTLDPTFGTGGKVWVDLFGGGSPDAAYAITTDASGNVYACGSTRTGGTPFTNDVAIIKLTPTGSPDPTFSGDGKLLLDVSGSWDFGYGIHVRSDGKIIVGGYAGLPANFFAVRLLPDGSYDNTFNGDGKVFIDIFGQNVADEVWGMHVDPDGKILLVGDGIDTFSGSISKGAIVRLTPDGNPDNTFDSDGIATFALSTSYNVLRSIVRMSDGRYVAAGEAEINMDKDYFIVRLMNDGSPDASFNGNGMYSMDLTGAGNDDFGYGLAIQPDLKILVSGNTAVNEFSNQKYSIARIMAPGVLAAFTASAGLICSGDQVQFTNTSSGENLSYLWTFEGGSPATSTQVNPQVTYNSPGIFDVKLIVYNSNYSDTLDLFDLIEVIATPSIPPTPSGPTSICNLQSAQYTTSPVTYATNYSWLLDPSSAGSLLPNGTSATFTASPAWTGPYTVKVNASNQCGTSSWSTGFNAEVFHMPILYSIQGNGEYCEGSGGVTITLNGSESGVSYELYLEGIGTGNVQSGTGNSLSWTGITIQGFYTVAASTPNCSLQMAGQIYVYMLVTPGQMSTPVGPPLACNDLVSVYSTSNPASGDLLVWTLLPAGAGTLIPSGNTVSIDWSEGFSGTATLSVHAENNCGQGPESGVLSIIVNKSPSPVVTGIEVACLGWSPVYQTFQNAGSTYSWSVTGGTITAGAGTSQVTIHWELIGLGMVTVTETSSDNCMVVSDPLPVEVDACVGFAEPQASVALQVFPNPAGSQINILLDRSEPGNRELLIRDLTGRVIFRTGIPAGTSELYDVDISNLCPGLYLLFISGGTGESGSIKVVKR